jgi:L-asparagine transporter-like permease
MEKKHKGLSAWQLTMMALGTVIGGSFFLGSSVAIHAAGPAILISYILGGILVYFILFALSEMTVANPDSGSFRTFAAQVFGPGTGFVVGWVYWTGMVLAMSSEATAVSILVREWAPNISIALLGSGIIIAVTLLNLLGADKLSKLESGLAAVKLLAIAAFIIMALLLIIGIMPGASALGAGELVREPLVPGGVKGIAGSMLIVIFSYAGFEIIGLAASETDNPRETVPKAIKYTVLCLVGFYIVSVIVLLPLIPTSALSEDVSPMVAALNRWGIGWAGTAINLVLITAILSTMLAAMFGLGRMMRSLADEGHAPKWLKDEKDVPYRGILFSGLAMLIGLGVGLLLPRVYLFLISSGGFALLFTYAAILATHIRFRKKNGCPPEGKCQMPGYPYTSWIALISIIIVILSMPLISGQSSGLIAGFIMVTLYSLIYLAVKFFGGAAKKHTHGRMLSNKRYAPKLSMEFSKELIGQDEEPDKDK